MPKLMDDDLNLEQLLARCKELEPETMICLFFDPRVFLFYISYCNELDFFLPPTTSFIGECRADGARLEIEMFIGNAVRHWIKSPE